MNRASQCREFRAAYRAERRAQAFRALAVVAVVFAFLFLVMRALTTH